MIITARYAKRPVKAGKATLTTKTTNDIGKPWQAVYRHDMQRVDHCIVIPAR